MRWKSSCKFLETFLVSDTAKKQADKLAVGNAQLTVTLGELKKLLIMLPPNDEQKKICKFIEPMIAKLNKTMISYYFIILS